MRTKQFRSVTSASINRSAEADVLVKALRLPATSPVARALRTGTLPDGVSDIRVTFEPVNALRVPVASSRKESQMFDMTAPAPVDLYSRIRAAHTATQTPTPTPTTPAPVTATNASGAPAPADTYAMVIARMKGGAR